MTNMLTTPAMDATRRQLEDAIKLWRSVRDRRLGLQHMVDATQIEETALKSWIIEVFKQQEQEGVVADARITTLTTRPQATIENKEAFLDYVRKTGELDLLQFRLSAGAVDLRKEDGVVVPGTVYIDVYDLSDKKL